jgi:voltage-dependent potassium channel beta subunit
MEYRRLGKSGLQVSALSFGSWLTFGNQIDDQTAESLMIKSYDAGINFFDNAEGYAAGKSEIVMGNILNKLGWDRDTYVVSSKVFWGGNRPNQTGLSRKHVIEACHAALKRLQVAYLDLYFCHRPDPHTPIEETVRAMSDLVRQGKVLYWGTSEWAADEIQTAYQIAKENYLMPPTMEQPQYNIFHRFRVEQEYANLYDTYGMGTTIWSPLASGLLTGKYNEGNIADTRANLPKMDWLKDILVGSSAKAKIPIVKKLEELAKSLDTTLPIFAIAWCLKNPNVSTVILGASKVWQLEENLKALSVVGKLNSEIMQEIEKIFDEVE